MQVYHAFYKPTEFFVPQRSPARCYMKVVCLRNTPQKVLGMHYLGPQGGEVIQGYAAAIKWVYLYFLCTDKSYEWKKIYHNINFTYPQVWNDNGNTHGHCWHSSYRVWGVHSSLDHQALRYWPHPSELLQLVSLIFILHYSVGHHNPFVKVSVIWEHSY